MPPKRQIWARLPVRPPETPLVRQDPSGSVPDAILDQQRPKWITRIVDSSLFAHCFFSPRTSLHRHMAEQEINIPAGSPREHASFGASCARRLEKKGSDRWVERTKRFSASKCPKHYGLCRSIGIKLALACPVALSRTRLVKVAVLDLKSQMPLQKLPESSAILVWFCVALLDTLVSERRLGSLSSSPPRPPVAGSSRTVLLIAMPPSCCLSFRPLCFQAPCGPALDVNNYMVNKGPHTTIMCGQQDRTTQALPSTNATQLLWVRLLIVLGGPYVFDIIVISALILNRYEKNPSDRYRLEQYTASSSNWARRMSCLAHESRIQIRDLPSHWQRTQGHVAC